MNKVRGLFAFALAWVLLIGSPLFAQADVTWVLDVADGHLISRGKDFPLAKGVDVPIEAGVIGGEIIIRIQTTSGLVEENWGSGFLSLTERAVSHVKLLEDQKEPSILVSGELCPICGRTSTIGYHKKFPCGHWGCLVSLDHYRICPSCGQFVCNGVDHTACEYCKVRMCVHVDLECEHTRNPAPSPYETKRPDGVTVYSYWDSTGTITYGTPGGIKPSVWSPSTEYMKQFETPRPTEE